MNTARRVRHLARPLARRSLALPLALRARARLPLPSLAAAAQRLFKGPGNGRTYTQAAEPVGAGHFEYLKRELRGQVLWVTMNRPKLHNAFNEHVIGEITRAFTNIDTDFPDARAVVLTGEGASFSAGADMNWMKKMADYSEEENKEDSLKLFDMFALIKSCPLPTVARINGAALGGGAGLVSACDVAISVDKAVFGFTEVGIGLIPAVISRFVMDKIGKVSCSRFFLTGERFDGRHAQRIGLVSESLASEEEMDAAVDKLLNHIIKASPAAVKAAKTLIEEVDTLSIAESRSFTTAAIARIRVSEEGQEGLKSFLEKRKPSWRTKHTDTLDWRA